MGCLGLIIKELGSLGFLLYLSTCTTAMFKTMWDYVLLNWFCPVVNGFTRDFKIISSVFKVLCPRNFWFRTGS